MTGRQDDYLWDRGGTIDPELERLETLLGRLGQTEPPPPLSFAVSVPRRRPVVAFAMLAMAASVALALVGATWWVARTLPAGFAVTRVAGTPRLESGESATNIAKEGRLRVGGWLNTPADARATIDVDGAGRVEVDPGSRLSLLSTTTGDYRLHLERGTLHAFIWAPPGQFSVSTPSSTAVDLGCAYTLSVGDDGDGLVRVTSGWVGFEFQGRESFIPSGAVCRTRRGLGPGTPHYEKTSEQFRAALDVLDFGDRHLDALMSSSLDIVLKEATASDGVTLWHLLTRVDPPLRDRVFTRFAELVPPPASVTRDGIRAGKTEMLDAWWNQLDLDTASWWRIWKQQWKDKGDKR